jgi:hypothetical protein
MHETVLGSSTQHSSSFTNFILILRYRRTLITRSRSTKCKSRHTLCHRIRSIVVLTTHIDTGSACYHTALTTFTHNTREQARLICVERGHGHGCHIRWDRGRRGSPSGRAVTNHTGRTSVLVARQTHHTRGLRNSGSLSVGNVVVMRGWGG